MRKMTILVVEFILFGVLIFATIGCSLNSTTTTTQPTTSSSQTQTGTTTAAPKYGDTSKLVNQTSSPGKYSGYSEEIYNSMVRTSKYIYIRGVNLAIDIYRPSLDGITPVNIPYPVIYEGLNRPRQSVNPNVIDFIVKRGYVAAIMDSRGNGASFGYRDWQWGQEEALDNKEVIEWLARQPWSDGKVGMFGESYRGAAQMLTAAQKPPSLVSIAPVVATIDQYMRFCNGVFLDLTVPSDQDRVRDTKTGNPVDADPNAIMAAAAVPEHVAKNGYLDDLWPGPVVAYRNDYIPELGIMPSLECSPITYADEIAGSGVAMYNMAGWWDQAPLNQIGAWKMWGGKLIIGPWTHGVNFEEMVRTEHLRWFDYTLKGINNKLDKEDPIYYATMYETEGSDVGVEWKFTAEWPLPNQVLTNYYFTGSPAGTVKSVHDGSLVTASPKGSASPDVYPVDYSVSVFDGTFRENKRYWDKDMTPGTDAKGLTYTSAPLTKDTEVTGHPVIHLWASSTATDGDFFVFLEEVDAKGDSQMVTNGMIRASNRALSEKSPWTEMGVPYHRCYDVDAKLLTPGEPVELVFDCYPTSWLFRKGSRIRVTITGSNAPIYTAYMQSKSPVVSVYHDETHPSYITLPVIP